MYRVKKICKECGKEFIATSSRQQYCKEDHYRPCPICNKPVLLKPNSWNDPPRCCSKECIQELKKRTCIEQYGVVDPGNSEKSKAKRRQTCLQRYGVDNPSKSDEIKQKIVDSFQSKYGVDNAGQLPGHSETIHKYWENLSEEELTDINTKRVATCKERYGVDNPRQNDEIKKKTKATLLDRYGVDCSLKIPEVAEKTKCSMLSRYGVTKPGFSEEIANKRRLTCIKKYGVPSYLQSDDFRQKYESIMREKYGVSNPMQLPEFVDKAQQTNLARYGVKAAFLTEESIEKSRQSMISNMKAHVSSYNRAFAELLRSLGFIVEYEKYINGRWYDLYLPNESIVIEIDPTYTHSSEPSFYSDTGVDKNYHKMKTTLASEAGYRCIHVFDWDDPTSICNMLMHSNVAYARKCHVGYIDRNDASEFLKIHHIQGSTKLSEVNIGLELNGELSAVMTFGKPRYTIKYQWELLRFATKTDLRIVGGGGKLFSAFIKDYQPESIISYCDLAKFTGSIYPALGFKLIRNNRPGKIWSKNSDKINNSLLLQRGYDQIFHTNYGKGMNNEELMIENGWRSVYDCGQAVYEWRKS